MLSPLRNRAGKHLREPFGKAGLIVGVIALVFAMLGGAYAASSNDSGKATASAKAKKGPRGPKGPKGDTGPTGPAGAQGPAGAKGDTGAKGDKGEKGDAGNTGTPGKDGTSPTGTSFSGTKTVGSVTCTEGGIEYKGATTNIVCNGKEGEAGEEGSPWTAGGTLPEEATETGTFLFEGRNKEVEFAPIGFPIPLSSADAAAITVHFWVESQEPALRDPECAGTPDEPKAEPGTICFYLPTAGKTGFLANAEQLTVHKPDFSGSEGVGTSGAFIYNEFISTASFIGGSWAITAPAN